MRKGELRSDFIGGNRLFSSDPSIAQLFTEPVVSVVPTQDGQTVLVTTPDSTLRLMDMSTGKMLNKFTGHVNQSYRIRGCFGHSEANIVCGDENGQVWEWDLLDVRELVVQSLF